MVTDVLSTRHSMAYSSATFQVAVRQGHYCPTMIHLSLARLWRMSGNVLGGGRVKGIEGGTDGWRGGGQRGRLTEECSDSVLVSESLMWNHHHHLSHCQPTAGRRPPQAGTIYFCPFHFHPCHASKLYNFISLSKFFVVPDFENLSLVSILLLSLSTCCP